jgi:hypothetical protein
MNRMLQVLVHESNGQNNIFDTQNGQLSMAFSKPMPARLFVDRLGLTACLYFDSD